MFAKKTKPVDLPSSILDNVKVIRDPGAKEKKVVAAREALETQFLALKDCLYGLNEVSSDDVRSVRAEVMKTDLPSVVLAAFDLLEFRIRKHFSNIVSCLLHKDSPEAMIQYIKAHPADVLFRLVDGSANSKLESQTNLLYLEMLKSCFQHRQLAEMVLPTDRLWQLFASVGIEDFAVSASALNVLKEVLLAFPDLLAKGVVGDRKRTETLIAELSRIMMLGSVSQKKKSIDMVAHLLHFAEIEPLLLEVGKSQDVAQVLAKLILMKEQVAVKAAVIVKGKKRKKKKFGSLIFFLSGLACCRCRF